MGTARRPNGASGTSADGEYAYVEVMACPGGCTNGGGQIKVGDVATLRQVGGTGIVNGAGVDQEVLPAQREWLAKVDEAYWSADSHDDSQDDESTHDGESNDNKSQDHDGDISMTIDDTHQHSSSPAHDSVLSSDTTTEQDKDIVDGISRRRVRDFLAQWSSITGIDLDILLKTTYRVVESDVGKTKSTSDVDRVNALAHAAGGGW
jgi:hypothetical protein